MKDPKIVYPTMPITDPNFAYVPAAKTDVRATWAKAGWTPKTIINAENVAVDHTYFWQPMDTCPMSAKVQLLTRTGVAVYGNGDPRSMNYVAWAPLPKIPEWLKEKLSKLYAQPSIEPHGY